MSGTATLAERLVAELTERGLTVAVAESLTGGLLVAELISVPGASLVVRGGVVAYATDLKHSLLGVDGGLLATEGPVHPEVAAQMAMGVRRRLGDQGVPADVGVATTGVAGPGPQDGHEAGTAYVAVSIADRVSVTALRLQGNREQIRHGVVVESLRALGDSLEIG